MSDTEEATEEINTFIELFGRSDTIMKILNTLMEYPKLKYTKKELAKVNDLSESTVLNNWKTLSKFELIETHDMEKGVTKYSLNGDSPILEPLYDLDHEVREFTRENLNEDDSNDE